MLRLKNIVKQYTVGGQKIDALNGVSIDFRENEFVSVLGQSGCGKTTMLNIIGGLDRYTSGDLIINGVSTKKFTNSDWDNYRNHSVGFVFQSYNLIPHQSVLANVELALTLSGVSKAERRKKAIAALNKVGLGDQLKKKPNQMSGGQMQRVAIARALVNNPDILLADEPTGALDSATSLQVMELLKEIAKEKLVIMVTHNPELANNYSTRIIKLLDGRVIDDSAPLTAEEIAAAEGEAEKTVKKQKKRRKKGTSMSFFTALSLSFNNLMTKKARTFLTSFAGSIGIIGIALILSISNGVQLYIDKVEEDTLSSYPITLKSSTVDFGSMMNSMVGKKQQEHTVEEGKIYSNDVMTDMLSALSSGATENDLKEFKKYIESGKSNIKDLVTGINYGYTTPMYIYKSDISKGVYRVNPGQVFENLGFGNTGSQASEMGAYSSMGNTNVWSELLNNPELLKSQYDVLAGKMPTKYNEVVVIVDKNNSISDYALYTLGLRDDAELEEMFKAIKEGREYNVKPTTYTYEDILNLEFKLLINTDYFSEENGIWVDKSNDELYLSNKIKKAETIKVVGILRPNADAAATSISGTVAYLSDLTEHLINKVNSSKIVKQQNKKTDTDVFTGLPFKGEEDVPKTKEELLEYIKTLPQESAMQIAAYMSQMEAAGMGEEAMVSTIVSSLFKSSDATLEGNLAKMGVADLNNPDSINIYPKDFASKDEIANIISEYNRNTEEAKQITYTDYIGIMMSSVTTIIDAISYILISFVAISLVVSSIMIGIITYISVLERTKEIGILRAIGASKKDISRVFNAETLIVGFVAGILGIAFTLLLIIPINAIIGGLTEISAAAELPFIAAVILVGISMLLTFIAGLVPSGIAARKDPVEALRSE